MRASLTDAALARYAGRFVWLELNYDKEVNQTFLTRHDVQWTPTLMVVDAEDEKVTAQHNGGITVFELQELLERGERNLHARPVAATELARQRGDALAGRGRFSEAATEYRKALAQAEARWTGRAGTVDALTSALLLTRDHEACAEEAINYALPAPRDRLFARITRTGLACANGGGDTAWAKKARKALEALGEEAVAVKAALRDDHFQLFQQLMVSAQLHRDKRTVARWGEAWLTEIDSTSPASDDERSALDIARLDAVSLLGQPERALPALAVSERAMPSNYSAAMRYAEAALDARYYPDALAASERGLLLVDGPMGRTRLLWIKAQALMGKHDRAGARDTLDQAAASAEKIRSQSAREGYARRIREKRKELDRPQPTKT